MKDVGLGAKLRFNAGSAVSEMSRAERASAGLRAGFNRASASTAKLQSGMQKLALAGSGVAVAFGFGMKAAASYEQALSGVGSVLLKSKDQITALRAESLRLGSTTAFTATEAANAMENLARAGFKQNEIIDATSSVLSAAAADSMGLADAATIVADTLRGMGLATSEASKVADVLALTSARTNTNISMLGEGFKYAATQAKNMGIPLEETSAVLGLLANAGLKGSIGGTSFTNMLVKMAKPTAKAQQYMKSLGAEFVVMTDKITGKKRVNIVDTIHSIAQGFADVEDPIKKARMASEIFGLRGQKAVGAFLGQLEKSPQILSKLVGDLINAEGAAAKMAEIRLDNLTGQFTLFKSAVEGFAINFFTLFTPAMTGGLKSITKYVSDLAVALQYLTTDPAKAPDTLKKQFLGLSSTVADTAKALKEAADSVVEGWKWISTNIFGPLRKTFISLSPEARKFLTIFIVGSTAALAVLGPLSIALASVGFIASGVVSVISGLGGVLLSAFWPVLAIVGALTVAFYALRKDGETPIQFLIRAWTGFSKVINDFVDGFKTGFMPMWEPLKQLYATAIKPVWDALKGLFQEIFLGGTGATATMEDFGRVTGQVLSFIATMVGMVMSFIGVRIANVISGYIRPLIRALKGIVGGFTDIVTGATSMREALVKIFAGIADIMILPFKYGISKVLAMIEGIGKAVGINMEKIGNARKKLNDFSFSGMVSPRVAPVTPPGVESPTPTVGGGIPVAPAVGGAGTSPKVDIKVEAPPVPDVRTQTTLLVDGKEISTTVANQQVEYKSRSGEAIEPGTREAAANYGG